MAGDGSTVQVCDRTDLLKDVSVDVNSTVTCVQLLIRNYMGFWMEQGRTLFFLLSQLVLIAGGVTECLARHLLQCSRLIHMLFITPTCTQARQLLCCYIQ